MGGYSQKVQMIFTLPPATDRREGVGQKDSFPSRREAAESLQGYTCEVVFQNWAMISTLTCLCSFMPAAPKIVRRASAVRPCRPITLPTSSGWTHNSSTITCCPSTERTSTSSGWSTRAFAIISSSSFMAHPRICVCINRKLSVCVSRNPLLSLGCRTAMHGRLPVRSMKSGKLKKRKGRHTETLAWRGDSATNPSGSDNLLSEVCALTSWKYSLGRMPNRRPCGHSKSSVQLVLMASNWRPKPMISEHWPELPQLGRRSVDRYDVFPVALGVEAIYLNRRSSMKSMLFATIGTAHSIDGRSYRPGPSKQHFCSARAIHHSLLRSWHQVRFALKAEACA